MNINIFAVELELEVIYDNIDGIYILIGTITISIILIDKFTVLKKPDHA